MSRKIRRVPARWNHPKDWMDEYKHIHKGYRPLYQEYFDKAYSEWEVRLKRWFDNNKTWPESYLDWNGEVSEVEPKYKGLTFEQYDGGPEAPPNPYDYMPFGEWYQLYETVSEGTPLSPPFPEPQLLVNWLTVNGDFWGKEPWPRERAEAMVEAGYVPSGVFSDGKMYRAEESLDLDKGHDA